MAQRLPAPAALDRVTILLMPKFPSLALAALTNVLRIANREMPRPVFEWRLASAAGGEATASDGLVVHTEPARQLSGSDSFLFVLAAYEPTAALDAGLLDWLRRQARHGACLVGIESGAHVLAAAGVLGDHAVALHPEDVVSFRETWPRQPLFNGIYHLGSRLATAAGVTATLDFALAFVESRRGALLADQVARVCLHRRRDELGRRMEGAHEPDAAPPLLQACRALMLGHLQEPLRLPAICARLGVPERRLRRLFRRALGVSPMRYYQALRLTEARFMLVTSDREVTEVGLACGFADSSAFARAFKAHFGFPPSRRRQPYMGLLPSPFWPQDHA